MKKLENNVFKENVLVTEHLTFIITKQTDKVQYQGIISCKTQKS